MIRRIVLQGLVVCTLAASLAGPAEAVTPLLEGESPAPNVVLILLDDARYDDMMAMPEVQRRIGDAGATFTHFYSPFPLCCPARATLLTGQYSHNHGVLTNTAPQGGFKEFNDASTLATWLDPTYRTGLIGKYFNQYAPPYTPPGWDEWMVPKGMYAYTGSSWWIDKGPAGAYKSLPGYQTDTIGALASDFVTRNAPAAEPFFLYASLVAPHDGTPRTDDPSWFTNPSPYVDARYVDRFAGQGTGDPSFNEANVSDKPLRPPPLSTTEIQSLVEQNAQRREAELSARDQVIRIIHALRASGELDNTYLMFTSDNGYILGEHRIRGGKVAPYEIANHVPFIVRGPGIPAGARVPDATSQIDFAPTVMEMAALPIPESVDGLSLLAQMRGLTPSVARKGVLIEATDTKATSDPLPWLYHGIVTDHMKYIERETGRKELYDLTADPYELVNVAGKPDYATKQARLAALLSQKKWCSGATCR